MKRVGRFVGAVAPWVIFVAVSFALSAWAHSNPDAHPVVMIVMLLLAVTLAAALMAVVERRARIREVERERRRRR